MSTFENETRVFHACESSEGRDAGREYVEPDARLESQARPPVEMKIWNARRSMDQLGRLQPSGSP